MNHPAKRMPVRTCTQNRFSQGSNLTLLLGTEASAVGSFSFKVLEEEGEQDIRMFALMRIGGSSRPLLLNMLELETSHMIGGMKGRTNPEVREALKECMLRRGSRV